MYRSNNPLSHLLAIIGLPVVIRCHAQIDEAEHPAESSRGLSVSKPRNTSNQRISSVVAGAVCTSQQTYLRFSALFSTRAKINTNLWKLSAVGSWRHSVLNASCPHPRPCCAGSASTLAIPAVRAIAQIPTMSKCWHHIDQMAASAPASRGSDDALSQLHDSGATHR